MVRPELWLPTALYDSITTAAPHLGDQRTKLFRVQRLAAFFGSGGLLHPYETTSRDITVLALLDVPDHMILSDGVDCVDTFKTTVKTVAKCYATQHGKPQHQFETPEALERDQKKWSDSMYENGKPGDHTVDVVRLLLLIVRLG